MGLLLRYGIIDFVHLSKAETRACRTYPRHAAVRAERKLRTNNQEHSSLPDEPMCDKCVSFEKGIT